MKEEGHPKGLYLMFFVEMWERFSYYGMRALLVLYMTKYLLFSTAHASKVYGLYTGIVYMTPLIGGYLADRYIGARKSIIIGAILMALGQFALSTQAPSLFYIALGMLIIGNGFFKPNISTMVGQLYEKNDPRRDGGFTIFYMGINLGALFSPLICGTLGEKVGWGYGFGAAGVGMVLGLMLYLWGQKRFLGEIGLHPVAVSSDPNDASNKPLTREEKEKIAVIFILAFFAVFFWAAFEQAGSSLTLFADQATDRRIPFTNWIFPASYFQAVNPLFIIMLAPLFSKMWISMAKKSIEPSTPHKFVCGLTLLGAGFVLMIFAAHAYQQTGPVSFLWLFGAYLLHTLGELCLSPVGLSLVTKLAPAKFASLLMGTWFLSTAAANVVGGMLAGNYDVMDKAVFFMIPTATAFGSAIVLLLLCKPLRKWMHGIN